MTEREVPCSRCHQENPPTNRFCGSCGAPLTSGEQLATRQEHRPVPAGGVKRELVQRHSWPNR
jgi:predicted amidophosphoribosyltransferase